MTKHTETPWTVHKQPDTRGFGWEIYSVPSSIILGALHTEANAAFIVKACNLHEELIKALEGYTNIPLASMSGHTIQLMDAIEQAHAVLAKANEPS